MCTAIWVWSICLIFFHGLSFFCCRGEEVPPLIKGQFFVHPINTWYFVYKRTVAINAFKTGYADLPNWLSSAPGRDPMTMYLYGTPEVDSSDVNITVLALDKETYETYKKIFLLTVIDNPRNFTPTTQWIEMRITNVEIIDLLEDPSKLEKLRHSISNAFSSHKDYHVKYDQVGAYLRNLRGLASRRLKGGATENQGVLIHAAASIAPYTFTRGVNNFQLGLQHNKEHCSRKEINPFDHYFSPYFDVDWCSFKLHNKTEVSSERFIVLQDKSFKSSQPSRALQRLPTLASTSAYETRHITGLRRDYFLSWVLVVGVPLVILILVILLLSAIFFGHREGQHWRDYKTPQSQLMEYVTIRRSQSKLRLMSQQRGQKSIDAEQLEPLNGTIPRPLTPGPQIGRQTVAEAAACYGTSTALDL